MIIGYDAKRAFENGTGLGHYSRTLLQSLATHHPENQYHLFSPKKGSFFAHRSSLLHQHLPQGFPGNVFTSWWRSAGVVPQLKKTGIQLYHGLSHEIPKGLAGSGIASVVTMHDLIHERYPHQYKSIDLAIYRHKFRYATRHAHRIIAISQQTAADLIHFYKADPAKIVVCYQSCNPAYRQMCTEEELMAVKQRYQLPDQFFLYVGSIIERKNLLTVCKALALVWPDMPIPLVVIGKGHEYAKQVKQYLHETHQTHRVIFLSETPPAQQSSFKQAIDFPAIYQQALCMIYPSTFEGFGIPVLEALCSRIPVITSNVSCLPEAGGPGAWYTDPYDAQTMAAHMKKATEFNDFRAESIDAGCEHSKLFLPEKCAQDVVNVYTQLL